MKRILACVSFALVLTTVSAGYATFPLGARAGFGMDPDQIVLGGHARVAEPMVGWAIQGVVELGFGDDVTAFSIDGDMLYTFPELETSAWGFYVGGGLGFTNYSWDIEGHSGSSSEFGLNLVGGATRNLDSGNKLIGELRIGLGDIPDFRIMGGIYLF